MACEVTVRDLEKEIKNHLIDRFGSSAKPTNGGQAVFISKDISTKGLGPRLQMIEAELNNKFGSKYFGNVITYYNEPHGYLIEIHPSQELADAMTAQNYRDEQNENYSRRENELSRITRGSEETKSNTRFQNISNYLRKNTIQEVSNESNSNETSTIKDKEVDLILKLTEKNPSMIVDSKIFNKKTIYNEGAESKVYLDLKNNRVIKINSGRTYSSWNELLDSISIHNELFQDTQYKFLGFTDVGGELGLVVSQPFINEEELNNHTDSMYESLFKDSKNETYGLVYDKLDQFMKEKGFEKYGGEMVLGSYINKNLGILVQDLNPLNFIINKDKIYVIDSDIKTTNSKFNDTELFSPRETNQQNSKRPITDNFVEYKRYKEEQLNKVKNILKSLQKDKRNPKKDTKTIVSDINKFSSIEAKLKNDIDNLNKNEVELMFHAINEEIKELNEALDNATDVENIKDRLDFLYKFVKGESIDNKTSSNIESLSGFNNPEFNSISVDLDKLNSKYKEKLQSITDEIIKTDISYVNNILNNDKITDKDLKEMFHSPNDINWMEKTFLGITSASNNDTIIPQVLKSFLETKVALREAEVKVFQDKLASLVTRISKKGGFDFIFEKTDKGTKTGNIINLISPKFNKMLSSYLSIDKDENKDNATKYKEKINWLKNNTEVIDFRRLKIVKDLYGSMYSDYFSTYTDIDAERYEQNLKNTLGPLYEQEISKVLNSLENFQLQKDAILSDTTNKYRFKNVAKIDPWAFIKNYNSPEVLNTIKYNAGGTNTEEVYSDIQNIRFIPIKDVFVTFNEHGDEIYKESGYYNKDFNDILNDSDKLEYWKLMKEIYTEYIHPTYDSKYVSEMSYAKFEDEWIEAIANAKGLLKGTEVFNQAIKGYKSFFFEKGRESNSNGMHKNYSDKSSKEILDLTKTLKHNTLSELLNEAKKLNIDSTNLDKHTLAKEIATRKVIGNYSTDINKVTSALLEMSALQKAKEDTLPIANVLLDAHKLASIDGEGNEVRKRSVERMENWFNRVIKGEQEKYRGGASFLGKNLTKNTLFGTILEKIGKIPLIGKLVNERKAQLFSDNEKEILKHLEELQIKGHSKEDNNMFVLNERGYYLNILESGEIIYNKAVAGKLVSITESEYEEAFQNHLKNKISELGLDLNTAGIIQGILKTIILKGLGLNPISGIFNRIEGKNSGLIMDTTGQYWTKGNIHKANNFMLGVNFTKFLPERFTPEQNRKLQEFGKLKILVNNMNLIQDRKNELERQADKSKFNYAEHFNIYQWAVENPEFKNQGAILLSILMDSKIKDISGNEVSIFDGKGFPAYNVVDNKLVLKPEFRTEDNIANWEDFEINEKDINNNQYFLTRMKIKNAISRSQGNYDNLDVINATKDIWGRAMTLFMKWMPEHFMQRFSSGKGIDLTTGKNKIKGRYRYLWENNPALLTSGLATLFVSAGITPLTGLAGLGLTGFVIAKYFKNLYSKKAVHEETLNTLEFVAFAKSVVISTLNYPLEFFNSNKMLSEDTGNKFIPGYSKTNLSQEEIDNLRAMAKELAIKLTFIAIMLLGKKLTWDDDDDKDSDRRQLHNFIDNQMSRNISSLGNFQDPAGLISDSQRLVFFKYLVNIEQMLQNILNGNKEDKVKKEFLDIMPIPRILYKGTMPWHDEREYESSQWQDRLIKNSNSNGEWSKKEEYEKLRKDKKEEFKSLLEEQGLEGDELDEALKDAMNREFPRKEKGETYSSILDRIQSGEKGKPVKKRKK